MCVWKHSQVAETYRRRLNFKLFSHQVNRVQLMNRKLRLRGFYVGLLLLLLPSDSQHQQVDGYWNFGVRLRWGGCQKRKEKKGILFPPPSQPCSEGFCGGCIHCPLWEAVPVSDCSGQDAAKTCRKQNKYKNSYICCTMTYCFSIQNT